MNIVSIKESGSNNILRWSIDHGADVYSDLNLQSIINDDLFYLITIEDVNFLELLRLSQMYREKLRIITEEPAKIPERSSLVKSFNGNITSGTGTPNEKSISMAEGAEFVCQTFLNLILQMETDNDIVPSRALRLFLPMMTRRFKVQIPFGFIDFLKSITVEEAPDILNKNYPDTLSTVIDNPDHTFNKIFNLGFIKSTEIIRYNQQYDKYLNVFKYQALKPTKDNINQLFKVGLLEFHCFNSLSRGEIRCSLFNTDKEVLSKSMSEFQYIDIDSTPIYFDFAIELPLQYMMILCISFSREVLTISYESSMASIIDSGIDYNDFVMPEFKGKTDLTEDEQNEVDNAKANIDAYRVRITEANTILMNILEAILSDEKADISVTDAFSLLPCIYKAKAVITVDTSIINTCINHPDEIISSMFKSISEIMDSVINDIKSIVSK